MSAQASETLIESSLMSATKAVGTVVRLKGAEVLQNELRKDYIITKEFSVAAGGLAYVEMWADARGDQRGADHNKTISVLSSSKNPSNPQQLLNN